MVSGPAAAPRRLTAVPVPASSRQGGPRPHGADGVRRPQTDPGVGLDGLALDDAEGARVAGAVAVVTHHEVLVGPQDDVLVATRGEALGRGGGGGGGAGRVVMRIGFGDRPAVDGDQIG